MSLMGKKKYQQGFSLVEVAIALMVSTVVVVGILSLYTQSVMVTKKMNQRFIAINLAKSRIERLKNFDFTVLPNAAETDTYLDKAGNSSLNGDFVRNTSISTNYNGISDLTQVTVTVDYKVKGEFSDNPVTLTTVFVDD